MSQQIPERFSGGAVDLSHLAARSQQPEAGSAAQDASEQVVEVPSLVFEVTDRMFDQVAQISAAVPVILELWAEGREPGSNVSQTLADLVKQSQGRLVLGRVEISANQGLARAFQVQVVPTVVALIGGRPVPLFQGSATEQQLRDLFDQLLQLAAQQGVRGRANASGTDGEADSTPAEPPVNPAHVPALEALERGDYEAAVREYEQVLTKAPADHEARSALVQARLLLRLQGASAEQIREAAASSPNDVEAQLRVADLDLSGGHVEDAFLRVLDLFAAQQDEAVRTRIRERLLELFEVVGQSDPRVAAARARLANLLY